MAEVRRLITLIFVYFFLLVRPISSQTSLNQVFQDNCQHDKLHPDKLTNCTLSLLEREYVLTAPIIVKSWNTFEIIAPNHTTIRCLMAGKEKKAIYVTHTKHVVFESISFVNCSRPMYINTSAYLYFTSIVQSEDCYSVAINNCHFPDFFQFAVAVSNTSIVHITNTYFKANTLRSYARAVTYKMEDSNQNVSFYAHNITIDGCKMIYPNNFQYVTPHLAHLYVGGALRIFIPTADNVFIRINDSKFMNSKVMEGGGILVETWNGIKAYDIDITGCHFEGNNAYEHKIVSKGGALTIRAFGHRGYVRIKNCRFINNRAHNGGALAVLLYERVKGTAFYVNISDSVFINNTAHRDAGGAIYAENLYMTNHNSMRIKNSAFENNEANSGGAILGINFWMVLEDNVTIRNNTAYYGGGVCLLGSGMTFNGSGIVMEGNLALHSGGAIYLHSSSWLSPQGNQTLIRDNTATIRGGAIFVFSKYYQNQKFAGWNYWHRNTAHVLSCFLQKGRRRDALVFSNNNVHNFGKLCMGYDIYTAGWASCDSWNHSSNFLSSNSITFQDSPKKNCSIALDIDRYDKNIRLESPCQIQVNPNIVQNLSWIDIKCNNATDISSLYNYHKRILNTIKSHANTFIMNETVHLFFPNYTSNINIQSYDILGNPIETLTKVIFTPINSGSEKNKFSSLAASRSGKSIRLHIKNKKFNKENIVFGKICLQSHATLNKVNACSYAIIGNCPNPFVCDVRNNTRHFKNMNYSEGTISIHPGILLNYINESESEYTYVFTHCTWPQCRCHIAATSKHCKVYLNAPEKQCREGLALPYCSKCSNDEERIVSQFSWQPYGNCFTCRLPYLMIFLYVIITLGITVIICVLGMDVFSDYTRSITFYSSTIYLFCVSGQMYEKQFVYQILSVPVAIFNLLVPQMYPFCLPVQGLISMAIFEMVAPFVFILYILIMIFFIKHVPYFSKFGKYDLVNKFWTIIVLTYAHLCNQAFNVLNCPQDSNQNLRWLFDAGVMCLHGQHLAASAIAAFLLFVLFTFPILMFFFSRSKNPDYRPFVLIYEERYRVGFKQWEMLKLYLRFIFPLIVSLLPYVFLSLAVSCSLVSIICLFLMVLNSVLQPATNKRANQFESICLVILAFTGFQRAKEVYIILFIPYILYLIYLVTQAWEKGRKLYSLVFKSRNS